MVCGGRGGKAGVGRGGIQWIAHRFHQIQLSVPAHFVTQAVHHDPSPGGLIEAGATGGGQKRHFKGFRHQCANASVDSLLAAAELALLTRHDHKRGPREADVHADLRLGHGELFGCKLIRRILSEAIIN